jgi:hypothetical protein
MSQIQQSVDVDVPVNVAYNQWTQFESFRSSCPASSRSPNSMTHATTG